MPRSFFDDPRLLAPRQTVRTALPGGGFVLQSPEALQPNARCVGEWLEHWARATPDALAFAEPDTAQGWHGRAGRRCAAGWVAWPRVCSI